MPSLLPDQEILDALRSAAPTPPQNLLEHWHVPGDTKPERSYRPWIAGLAAATVCGVALTFLPGSPVRPTPLFADVEEAMLRAKTVCWTERWDSAYAFSPDGHVRNLGPGSSTRFWADLRIPAIAQDGGRIRRVSRDGQTYQIANSKRSLRTYQVFRWSMLVGDSILTGKWDASKLRTAIIRSLKLSRQQTQGGGWKSQTETIRGHEYLKLTRKMRGYKGPGIWKVEFTEYSYWVDPATRRIFKRETRDRYKSPYQTVDNVSVCEDFHYDETPPAGVFDIRPPVGSHYIYIPQPDRKPSPADQKAMETIVRKAEKAWDAGDAATYLSLWRFYYPILGSTKAEQLAALRNPKRYRWADAAYHSYRPGTRISGMYTYQSGDTFPPKEPVEFGVGAWGLVKERNTFKIVRVTPPLFSHH